MGAGVEGRMTTSGVYSFSVSRDDIIYESMVNVGALGEGETATAQEVTDCARKLNMIVKQWMGKQDFAPGLKMWTRQRGDLFLLSNRGRYLLGPTGDDWAADVAASAGSTSLQSRLRTNTGIGSVTIDVGMTFITNFNVGDHVVFQLDVGTTCSSSVVTVDTIGGTFTIPASTLTGNAGAGNYVYNYTTKGQRPLNILTCVLRDAFGNDTPLNRMTLEDYELLPSKGMSSFLSDPTAFYYESQLTNGVLWLDVFGAQDVTKYLHIVWLRPVQDFVNPADTPEYPQQWFRPLTWGLSKEIAPMFDAEWTEDMEDNLNTSLGIAREADSDVSSMYFQVNADGYP
jgi:hypothetical protein